MHRTENENILFYARATTPVKGLYRQRRAFKWGYLITFFFTFLINLAYLLGLWLQVEAGDTLAAQDNFWFCLVFTLALAGGALCTLIKRHIPAVLINCLSALVLLVGVWGNMFLVEPGDGLVAADGILYTAPIALLLLVLFSVLHFTAWYLRQKQVQRAYNRIVQVIYNRLAEENGGTVQSEALQVALNAYSGQDLKSLSGRGLSRSEKVRLRKQGK